MDNCKRLKVQIYIQTNRSSAFVLSSACSIKIVAVFAFIGILSILLYQTWLDTFQTNKDKFIELYSCPETAGMAFTHVKDDVDEDVDADVNDVETFCGHG